MRFDSESRQLIKRLWNDHVKEHRLSFAKAFCFMILAALGTSALPYLLQPVFDDVFTNGTTQTLIFFCSAIMVAFIIKGIGAYGESVVMTRIGQTIISDIQARLFGHLMHSDLSMIQGQPTGVWISHLTQDVQNLRHALSHTIIGLGRDALTFISLIAVMFLRDPVLATFAFCIVPWVVIPVARIGRSMRKVTDRTQTEMAKLSAHFIEVITGIRMVKAYKMEDQESVLAHNHINDIVKLVVKSARVKAAIHPVVESLGGLAIISVIAYGGWQVMHHERTTGAFLSFIAALLLIYEPLKRLCQIHTHIQEGLASASRVMKVIDTPPHIEEPKQGTTLNPCKGSIEFQHVSFSYQPDQLVIQDISLSIKRGQTIAFVGPSGGGKSTLINLVARFYDTSSGHILIDSHNVRDLPQIRQYISLVSQETAIFNRSTFDNIAYGIEATQAQVEEVAKQAAAHEFITQLPEGYQTILGEQGNRLSGGQKQRIAIARALLKNAPILLLDEATSALDTQNEQAIQQTLNNTLMKNRTTLIVAHRLSTIQHADCIYVIESGRIAESGTHQMLIASQGLYYQMWNRQQNENAS